MEDVADAVPMTVVLSALDGTEDEVGPKRETTRVRFSIDI